jgi:hypothetical protein
LRWMMVLQALVSKREQQTLSAELLERIRK